MIARYKSDEFSPIQEVKANTRVGYVEQLSKLEQAIGHMKVEDLDYVEIKKSQRAMQEKGRSITYIHRFFNTLRRVARYGKALKIKPAAEVASVLAEMRFPTGAARQIAPTREQVYKIVAAADANGRDYFALGILIQYEFSLRAVDVRGHWLATNEQEGRIIRNGKRWQDGLTWDMFDTELTQFKNVISKTIKPLPAPYTFDLTLVPEIRSRLQKIRQENPVGPVIIATRSDGLPYTRSGWTRVWAKMKEDAKVPKDIWLMDLRAGGVTEAKNLGADPYALRDAAQHRNTATTDRYSRDRSDGANKIVQLRQAK